MLTIASLTATAAQAVTSETPLRELAASAGIFVGAAANYLYLTGSEAECQWENCTADIANYSTTLGREFSLTTAENAMKFKGTESVQFDHLCGGSRALRGARPRDPHLRAQRQAGRPDLLRQADASAARGAGRAVRLDPERLPRAAQVPQLRDVGVHRPPLVARHDRHQAARRLLLRYDEAYVSKPARTAVAAALGATPVVEGGVAAVVEDA